VTHSRPGILELLDRHGLSPSRALGQNFVADPNTVRRIVRFAEVTSDTTVIEIGPGLGSLTLALAETGATVVAVEIDRHLIPVLTDVLAGTAATVVHADALEVDFRSLIGAGPATLVANLPYNVSVPLVMRILEEFPEITSLLVMVQREVGERLVAPPRSEAYGAVSVKVAYFAHGSVVARVPASVFVPRPNVESVLVRLIRHEVPAAAQGVAPSRLFDLIKQAFGQRRKMLRSTLKGLLDDAAFDRAGVAGTRRAEELGLDEFAALAREATWTG
jgi:16S rRNA (adenine1518-N6/adenine1519-N6)-dimethyltransferase